MQAWLTLLAVDPPFRFAEPPGLAPGAALPLRLVHRERWSRTDITRVILGSDPTWADLVLVDEPLTIHREHARFYLNHAQPEQSDFRAMKGCPVEINGQPHPPFEWVRLPNGSELRLAGYRFRYEWRP